MKIIASPWFHGELATENNTLFTSQTVNINYWLHRLMLGLMMDLQTKNMIIDGRGHDGRKKPQS